MACSSSPVIVTPVGFDGAFTSSSLVRGVIAASMRSGVSLKSGYVSIATGRPPSRFTRCLYMTKYGSAKSTSSPGSTNAVSARNSPPDTPPVIITFSSGAPNVRS